MRSSGADNSKRLALSGLLLALAVAALFLASIMPTSKLSLYALSSFFIAVIIIEYGTRAGWVFYAASCLLALIVVQDKLRIIPYIVFFGIYGILKLYIERLRNIVIEYVLKLAYFNICLVLAIIFIKEFLFTGLDTKFPWWIVIAALQVVFVIYDYVYSLFIQYYNNRLKKMLGN